MRRGLTLLEVMVVIGILGLGLGTVFSAWYMSGSSVTLGREKAYLNNLLLAVISLMARELKSSDLTYIKDSQGQFLQADTLYSGIKFKIPIIDSQGNRDWSGASWIEYDINATGEKILRVENSTSRLLLGGVDIQDGSGFVYLDDETKIRIVLEAEKEIFPGRKIKGRAETAITWRN